MSQAANDGAEALLFTLLRRFEALALERYFRLSPGLATAQKRALVDALVAVVPGDAALAQSELAAPVADLLAAARAETEAEALLLHGLLLEPLGQAIYQAVLTSGALSERGRALAELGLGAAAEVVERAPALIGERLGAGDALFNSFAASTRAVLAQLDAIGEQLDRHFGDAYALRFADLVGDVASSLLPACIGLGMNRRKVVVHLTSSLMGAA